MNRIELVKLAADVLQKSAQTKREKMEKALDTRGSGANMQFWMPWLGFGVGAPFARATHLPLSVGGFTAASLITAAINRSHQKRQFMEEFGQTPENERIWEASQKSYNKAYAVRKLWNIVGTPIWPLGPLSQLIRPSAIRRQEAINKGMEQLNLLAQAQAAGKE